MIQEPADTIPLRVALVVSDADMREKMFLPGLLGHGFDVAGMGSAGELYRWLLNETADIVVLDTGLPDGNGFEVARHLRTTLTAGIVVLTAQACIPDWVHGLAEGADAYLAKPVRIDLLAANLNSLGRRIGAGSARPPAARSWHVRAEEWQLLAPNRRSVDLTAGERCILQVLSAASGSPVSRDDLIAELTDNKHDFDPHRLEMIVYRLRRKVHKTTGMELPLRAVRGEGYLLAADQRRWR